MAEGQAAYDSVFRRADPARQGRIAPDAFAEYFGDGVRCSGGLRPPPALTRRAPRLGRLAACDPGQVSSRREMDDLFSIVDEDGDGWIEPDELQPFVRAPPWLRAHAVFINARI